MSLLINKRSVRRALSIRIAADRIAGWDMLAVAHSKRASRHPHSSPVASAALLSLPLTLIIGYALLEKKMLPKFLWRPLSALYFYPMMLPNLFWRVAFGKQSYFSDIDGGVMLGAVPMVVAGHVKALHEDGVRAVLNMQAEYPGPLAAYAALHPPIKSLRIPVVDHTEPTVQQLIEAVDFISAHRARGERVLVHCKGGHGRSAAVAMAWLISEQGGGMTPEEAQRRLSSVRHVRSSLFKQPDILEFYARTWAKAQPKGKLRI